MQVGSSQLDRAYALVPNVVACTLMSALMSSRKPCSSPNAWGEASNTPVIIIFPEKRTIGYKI